MIIPPFGFPHRLQKSSVGDAKILIFISAFQGIAITRDEIPDEEIKKSRNQEMVCFIESSNNSLSE
jgi:hypothetical protein